MSSLKKLRAALTELPRHALTKYFPLGPEYINYSATDVCNYRCVMCNIWKNKRLNELSLVEFEQLFSQKFFKSVRHFGISGGEPFLINDLNLKVEILLKHLPKLKSISIISNGSMPDRTVDISKKIESLCKNQGKRFGIAISVDGIGEVHNHVRGLPTAYAKTSLAIAKLREAGIKPEIFCTIVKENVESLYEVYAWAQTQGLSIKFRIATEVKRLSNADCHDKFVEEEFSALESAEWVSNLIEDQTTDSRQRLLYESMLGMLAYKQKRSVGCYWQRIGATIDASGNLYYCGVKSPMLGSGRNQDAHNIFFSNANLETREKIIQQDCSDCIHDYKGPLNPYELANLAVGRKVKKLAGKLVRVTELIACLVLRMPALAYKRIFPAQKSFSGKKALITGWYGTETAGDKAILAKLIDDYQLQNFELSIFSTIPFYTRKTLIELGKEKSVKIVPMTLGNYFKAVSSHDVLVVGGGPLMNIGPIFSIELQFVFAAFLRKTAALYYCGVGPLGSHLFQKSIRSIVRLSDVPAFRDKESAKWAAQFIPTSQIRVDFDPAFYHVKNFRSHGHEKENTYVLAVRDWPIHYKGNLGDEEFSRTKEKTLSLWVELVNEIVDKWKAKVILLPMNTYFIGDDDRHYLYQIKKRADKTDEQVSLLSGNSNLKNTIETLKMARGMIGMRFHSVVFAAALDIPFVGCDYTVGGGKISRFVSAVNANGTSVSLDTATKEQILSALHEAVTLSETTPTKKECAS